MKLLLTSAAVAALVFASVPASAQHAHGGGGHGGGGFHGGGSFHGGGGFRGGYRGGYYGPRGGLYFGFGAPYYYSPYYYGPPDYYYGYPSYPPYSTYDYDDQDDYGPPPPPPPPERDYSSAQPRSNWHVTHQGDETDFELPDSVLFALDSAHVSKDADKVLQEIADAAHDRPGARLVVEGYTDTSGSHEHNATLSRERADAVAAVLARQGVEKERISTEGLGETHLAVQTGDGVREPRNRRVLIRLIGGRQAER